MKLLDFISRKAIVAGLKGTERKAVILELVTAMKKANATDKIKVEDVAGAVLERELKVGSTGLGHGVAIPHARVDAVKSVVGVFGRAPKALDFAAVDGAPVDLFFMIVSPVAKQEEYAEALKTVAQAVKAPNFCKFLRAAKTVKDIEEVFKDAESMSVKSLS